MNAPLPPNESERLRALHGYRILDTVAEKVFDDLTRLAATICETPISLVSLVDEDRQWFKSRHGLDATETPREQAFCAHTILDDEPLIVEDASKDARFADNPLVTGAPDIRFYAGVPLKVRNGVRLGTLCVIDREPRVLTPVQRETLEILRDAVVGHLELKRAVFDLNELEGVIPMCAWCRSVRIGEGATEGWMTLHEYVASSQVVTHGLCPHCRDEHFLGAANAPAT